MEMDVDEIEKEIKRTEEVKDTNLQTRAERAGVIVAVGYGVPSGKTARPMGSKLPWTLMVLGIVGLSSGPAEAFTAYDCSNRSNIVESFSLLEPDACAA